MAELLAVPWPAGIVVEPHRRLWADFLAAVRAGRPPSIGAEGVRIQEVMDAIYAAAGGPAHDQPGRRGPAGAVTPVRRAKPGVASQPAQLAPLGVADPQLRARTVALLMSPCITSTSFIRGR